MFQRQLGRHLGRHLLVLPLLAGLAGCELDSPVGVSVPGLPIPGGTIGSTSHTTVTGNLAARKAAIQPIAERYATAQGLPVGLVMAVIEQESGFQPGVTSSAGAQGLMQLMPETVDDINARAPGIHISDPFDPEQNVAGGCWYLAWVHQQVPLADVAAGEDWKLALAGYNGGIGRVQGAIEQAREGDSSRPRVSFDDIADLLPAETRNYVPAVVSHWQTYGDIASAN